MCTSVILHRDSRTSLGIQQEPPHLLPHPKCEDQSHQNKSDMSFFFLLNIKEEGLEAKPQTDRTGGEIRVMITEGKWLRAGEAGM